MKDINSFLKEYFREIFFVMLTLGLVVGMYHGKEWNFCLFFIELIAACTLIRRLVYVQIRDPVKV